MKVSKKGEVGLSIIIDGKDIEECIETAIHMWKHENPEEIEAYKRYIQKKRSNLNKETGMSEQGHLRSVCEVPAKLAKHIQKLTHKDWSQDKKIIRHMYRVAPYLFTGTSASGGAGV